MAGNSKTNSLAKRLSYADYCRWGEEFHCELIDGVIYDMTPAPGRLHQEISGDLFVEISNHLKGHPCKAYIAPFDVRFPKKSKKDEQIFTVLQPDISVFCDEGKLDEKGAVGAPDLVIEVISPATASKDNIKKRSIYEQAGVREFWLVHPVERWVRVCRLLKDGRFDREDIYGDDDKIKVSIFPDLIIDMKKIFPPQKNKVCEPPPREEWL